MYAPGKGFATFFALAVLLSAAVPLSGQSYFRNWPAGTSPQEVGRRVAENFVARKLEAQEGKRKYVIYPEACAWYGALTVAQLTNNPDLRRRLIEKFDPLLGEHANRISADAHVDYRVIGIVPLEIYLQTKQAKYLDLGQGLADKQWEKTTADGITAEARYWIDDAEVGANPDAQLKYYLDRARRTGHLHGQAPLLWSATALMR